MAAELPVFGIKAKGLNSLVQNGKTGYLQSNIKNLSNKIIELKHNQRILKELGFNARNLIKKKFKLEKSINLENKIIEKLINEKKY